MNDRCCPLLATKGKCGLEYFDKLEMSHGNSLFCIIKSPFQTEKITNVRTAIFSSRATICWILVTTQRSWYASNNLVLQESKAEKYQFAWVSKLEPKLSFKPPTSCSSHTSLQREKILEWSNIKFKLFKQNLIQSAYQQEYHFRGQFIMQSMKLLTESGYPQVLPVNRWKAGANYVFFKRVKRNRQMIFQLQYC